MSTPFARVPRPVQDVDGLLVRLDVATRSLHPEVDMPWLGLLHSRVSREQYLAVLARTYGLIAPLESACRYAPGVALDVDIRARSRAGLLARDLLSLGMTPADLTQLPHCHAITTFRGVPEALGWMYLVERSALRADVIRRHLLRHAPWAAVGCAYLSEQAETLNENWSAFGRKLDAIAASSEVADEIVTAAHATFVCTADWYRASAQRSTDETDPDRASP